MNIFESYLKFTNCDGAGKVTDEYVSVYQYTEAHPDCYQGDLSDILYKKVGEGFVPI